MPVTVVVAPHITATTVKGPHQQQRRRPLERSSSPAFDILRAGCPGALGNSKDAKLIQSSVDETQIPCILPLSNGFVDTCLLAYNQHHHLVIRPDDVWCAILAQFNLYVNGHAEEMREWFVAHEGKKELEIVTEGSSQLVDWGWLSETMGRLIKASANFGLCLKVNNP